MNKPLILGVLVTLLIICLIVWIIDSRKGSLNKIKSRKVGNGQYGSAEWASVNELSDNLKLIKYEPQKWRQGVNLPKDEGFILGSKIQGKSIYAYVDTSDNHTMFVAASGGGKTSSILYPNLEYCGAVGMSFFNTDTKGEVFEKYAQILKKYYNYVVTVIDLRYPNKSDSYNLMGLVNKYMDLYSANRKLSDKAKAEAYAKNIGNVIIHMEGFKSAGQNQFFYDTAEAVISAITLLVSELSPLKQRHIVSVFKIIRQLMEVDPETLEKKNVQPQLYLQELYKSLPEEHICKDLLAPAATAEFKTLASILGTAMSNMIPFIDSEIEQIICFDGNFDIDEFVKGKHAVFFVFDEKMNTRNFMVNLVIRQFYGELIQAADYSPNNRLPIRANEYLDEIGTMNAIDNMDTMFSAARSRNIILYPFLQTTTQLEKNYGREVSQIIKSNCQNLMFSFLAPQSTDAEKFEKILGTQTIQTGSVSNRSGGQGSGASSQTTYSMAKKPLMFADEITNLKKGEWVLKKTGMNPAKMKFLKCENWGIEFDDPYILSSKSDRKVEYADRAELMTAIRKKYRQHYYPSATSKSAPPLFQEQLSDNETVRTINEDYLK